MIKVVIADDNRDFATVLAEFVSMQTDLELCGVAYNGKEALSIVQETKPDVLVLDIVMPLLDGIGVLEHLSGVVDVPPKVIVLTGFGQDHITHRAIELGAFYFMLKPFDLPTLIERIKQISDQSPRISVSPVIKPATSNPVSSNANIFPIETNITSGSAAHSQPSIETRISQIIHDIGIPAHIKGYQYIREAVALVYKNPDVLGLITKELYPSIAERYKTTPARVERAIRHSVELAWNRGDMDTIRRLFGPSFASPKTKPSNSEFVAIIAEKLRREYGEV